MNLQEALRAGKGFAEKHVDGTRVGKHVVSKANISAGYYHDFQYDDWREQPYYSTSFYYGPNELDHITSFAGEEGWEPR